MADKEKLEKKKRRLRLGCMIKESNLDAIKSLNAIEDYKSEGAVVDDAIERLVSHINSRKDK